jgi:UDP-glucose 4-epimerase
MAFCLVTGGAGFIGSHLVEALLARRHAVRVLDDFSTGKRANLETVLGRIELIAGDIADPKTVRAVVRGVDWIFHLAATTGVQTGPGVSLAVHNTCATGTLHLLEAAREARVQRVVHSSSAGVYRQESVAPLCEPDMTLPGTVFAAAQLAAEHYCLAFSQTYGLETVRLRYFDVFGPRQSSEGIHASIVARFLQEMQRGRGPVIAGDGRQARDFTYVEDVIQANLLAAEAPRVSGKLFNIASGQPTSLLELVTILNHALGTKFAAVQGAGRSGETRHSLANIVRAQTELGFCPCTDLETDVRRCLVESGHRSAAALAGDEGDVPVRSAVTCYRLDGPAATPTNFPHRKRDRTSRIP